MAKSSEKANKEAGPKKSGHRRVLVGSGSFLREVSGKELGHGEGPHPLGAEDLGHLLVGDEELLVLGVL